MSLMALFDKLALLLFVAMFVAWEAGRPARAPRRSPIPFDAVAVLNVALFSVACKWLLTPAEPVDSAPFAGWPLAARYAAALVAIDFTLYWVHRALHSRIFWNTHRFHHSVRELNWLSGIYTSGTHIVFYIVPQVLIASYLFGFSAVEMVLVVVIGYFVQLWQHANVRIGIGRLRYLFVTPQSHRRHHARGGAARNVNFGAILSLWDVLFGTWAEPADETYELGVDEDVPVVRGLIGF